MINFSASTALVTINARAPGKQLVIPLPFRDPQQIRRVMVEVEPDVAWLRGILTVHRTAFTTRRGT
jgi:hypothetical protein